MSRVFFLFALAAYCLAGCPGAPAAQASQDLDFTPDELRFIREHPVVSFGAGESFDPFITRNEDGSLSGIDIDVANLISERTGLKFHFTLGKWDEIVKRAERGEFDGITSSFASPARARHFIFTKPYAEYVDAVIVAKNNPAGIHNLHDLAGKRAAVMSGNINNLRAVRQVAPAAEIVLEKNAHDVLRSLTMGRNDFTVAGEPAFYIAATIGLSGLIETAFPSGGTSKLCFSVRKDLPQLVSVINKALQSIPTETIVAIRNKWLSGAAWAPVNREGEIKLTVQEREYLSVHHSLGVCVKRDEPPFGAFSSDGEYRGINADFIHLADKTLGSGARLYPIASAAPLQDLPENKCDLALVSETPENSAAGLMFTTPYLTFPYVIAAKNDKQFTTDFHPENNQIFAVPEDSPSIPSLRRAYPGIRLQKAASLDDGLKMVLDGKCFGLIAPAPMVSYAIQDKYLTDLKIIGQTSLSSKYSVATRTAPTELNDIFQKIVGNFDEQQKRSVVNKWMAVKYESGVDAALIWKIALGVSALLAVILYWSWTLGRAKRRAEEALAAEREAIKANLDFIDMISHEYRSPLSVISSNLDLIEEKTMHENGNDVSREVTRMRNSARKLIGIFESSLTNMRIENASIRPSMRPVDIRDILLSAVRDVKNVYPDHTVAPSPGDLDSILADCDPDLLNVAALNILDNACKYSETGRPVFVSLRGERGKAILTVSDQGVGVREEDLERVFEKYYRAQNTGNTRGAGVGLYLVKKIAALHGGDVHIASKFGQGTEVAITLPITGSK